MSGKAKKIRIVIILAVLGTAAFLGNQYHAKIASRPRDTVDISGVIEFRKINLSFKNSGKIVELNFDEGMNVKKGDILARQDISDLLVQQKKLEQVLAYSQSLIPQLEASLAFQKANQQSQIMSAAANLAAAQARLDEAIAGNREEQIEQARAGFQKAQIEYLNLSQEYKRHEQLLADNAITKQTFDSIKTQYLAAEQVLLSSREQYNLLKAGSRKETIALMKAQVEQAKAQQISAEAITFQIKKTECELESLQKDIEIKKADLETVAVKIADAVLYAPEDGIMMEKFSEISEVVGTASPIGVMANMKDVWVRGYIPEQDLGCVKLNATVNIIGDTYPDKVYTGYLAFISPEAEFTPKNIQTKMERIKLVYRVKINVDNSSGELKLGMPVDAKIPIKSHDEAERK